MTAETPHVRERVSDCRSQQALIRRFDRRVAAKDAHQRLALDASLLVRSIATAASASRCCTSVALPRSLP
jgi:hypothetical protein